MRASDLFPTEQERQHIKQYLDLFNGEIVEVIDLDTGKILFQNRKRMNYVFP